MTTVLKENVHVFGGECWDKAPGTPWLYLKRWARTKLVNLLADHPSPFFSFPPFLKQSYFELGNTPWLNFRRALGYTVS